MKTIQVLWNSLLTIAVIVLFATLNQFAPKEQEATKAKSKAISAKQNDTSKSSSLANAKDVIATNDEGTEIVFVNTDTLLENYQYFKKMRGNIEAKGKKIEQDLIQRRQALETEFGAAQQKAQSGAMSREQMASTEQQLMAKQQQFMQYSQAQEAKLADEEKKLSENLNKALREFLEKYAKERGYKFILGYSTEGGILYADDSKDVTAEVLQEINKK